MMLMACPPHIEVVPRGTFAGDVVSQCLACNALVWGDHQHVVISGLGDPHYFYCADCGVLLGTRQLPPTLPIRTHGPEVCGDCGQGRREEAERDPEASARSGNTP